MYQACNLAYALVHTPDACRLSTLLFHAQHGLSLSPCSCPRQNRFALAPLEMIRVVTARQTKLMLRDKVLLKGRMAQVRTKAWAGLACRGIICSSSGGVVVNGSYDDLHVDVSPKASKSLVRASLIGPLLDPSLVRLCCHCCCSMLAPRVLHGRSVWSAWSWLSLVRPAVS